MGYLIHLSFMGHYGRELLKGCRAKIYIERKAPNTKAIDIIQGGSFWEKHPKGGIAESTAIDGLGQVYALAALKRRRFHSAHPWFSRTV